MYETLNKIKARKLSNTLTAGGSSGSSPLTYSVNAPSASGGGLHRLGGGGGVGVASSMNLWGGGTNFGGKPRNLSASVKRPPSHTEASVCNLHNNNAAATGGTGSTQAARFKQLAGGGGGGTASKFKLDRMNTAAAGGGSNTIQ